MSAYTADQLAALREAYANGVAEITYSDGRRVRYQSMGDMAAAIARIEADLQAATAPRVSHYNPTFSRGT